MGLELGSGSGEDSAILLVEDDRGVARFTSLLLERHGFSVEVAYTAENGKALLRSRYFPVVVTDLCLGAESGLSLIEESDPQRPSFVILLTGRGDMETTVQAIHQGAFAYLSKPLDLNELETSLVPVIHRALKQIKALVHDVGTPIAGEEGGARTLVGKSAAIIGVFCAIAKASLSRGNVIILGETGTGKELVARAIHEKSRWVNRPFVTVNCSALTETLLESELFGHVKGAFTGALSHKKGLFEEANGGTLFLDEVGDISLAMQVKLLRAIQEGEIRPVGASENQRVDVRVIAATHRNLEQDKAQGRFREDLYYRLKVFWVEVPPLRERKEDLPLLIQHFIARSIKKNECRVTSISEEAMRALAIYAWPGNIRELENAIERAVAMSKNQVLFLEDFPPEIASLKVIDEKPPGPSEPGFGDDLSLAHLERNHIMSVLENVGFNKSKTAEILGIDRGTLYRKALRYSIPLEERD